MPEMPKKLTVTFEELAFSNMLTINALVELLTEKGVLSPQEILDSSRRLRASTLDDFRSDPHLPLLLVSERPVLTVAVTRGGLKPSRRGGTLPLPQHGATGASAQPATQVNDGSLKLLRVWPGE
jgi:hypothetical protein